MIKIRSKIESSYIGEQKYVGFLASELLFCCCSYFATIYSIFAVLRRHLARTSQGVCGVGRDCHYARSRVQDRTWAGKKTRVESELSCWHTVQQFNPLRVLMFKNGWLRWKSGSSSKFALQNFEKNSKLLVRIIYFGKIRKLEHIIQVWANATIYSTHRENPVWGHVE